MADMCQTKLIRNLDYYPHIDAEGVFVKHLPRPRPQSDKNRYWFDGLPVHDRVHYHQTLNSARRFAGFRAYTDRIPHDALDVQLQSQYQHGAEVFADKADCVLTDETMGRCTFRRLRNTKDDGVRMPPDKDDMIATGGGGHMDTAVASGGAMDRRLQAECDRTMGHPLRIGGIREHNAPDNVKMMCSGHHTTTTNPGYSRQPGDGNCFNY